MTYRYAIPLSTPISKTAHITCAEPQIKTAGMVLARVSLVTRISPENCAQLALGYVDPAVIELGQWQNREDEGILYVPRAGEMLYRVKGAAAEM